MNNVTVIVAIKSAAGAYCSDKQVIFRFPETHHVLAICPGFNKFFVVVPWDTYENPVPHWMPTLCEVGSSGEKIIVHPVNPLELTRRFNGKDSLWTQTNFDNKPQMCIANLRHFGWEFDWSYGVEVDLNPELTSFERGVNTIIPRPLK